jgi:predicted DNA-binding mobile mystery protein A
MRNQRKLLVEQLDRKILPFIEAGKIQVPGKGWIHNIRTTLNMTLAQLGHKLSITRQGVKRIEESEASGTITLNLLKDVGNALEMRLIYGFIPKHGSIGNLIDQKARNLAEKIVLRTSHHMMLEDQATDDENLKIAIQELTLEIKSEVRRSLWD